MVWAVAAAGRALAAILTTSGGRQVLAVPASSLSATDCEVTMYAALIEDGTVVQVIVGDPVWARARLGGEWVGTETLVGIGWPVVEGQIVPPEPGETDVLDLEMES
jgi:hypothetical protein